MRCPETEPMARRPLTFVCQNCGAVYGRWQGKCESCGEWNTISEEGGGAAQPAAGPGGARRARDGRSRFTRSPARPTTRRAPPSGIAELDRVTGGGFVRGSVLLVGGDPGIGKSTLLIQAAAAIARGGHRAVYISGEEAVAQVRLRAERLGLSAMRRRARRRDRGRGHRRHALRGQDAARSSWSIPSRPCGPTPSSPPPAR